MASPSDSTPAGNPPDPASQALLEISQDGIIVWAAAEALAWWGIAPGASLVGQPLARLFVEMRDAAPEVSWPRLLGQAHSPGARLTAHAAGGPFATLVLITPKGEPDASGRDTYIAAIERSPAPSSDTTPPANAVDVAKPRHSDKGDSATPAELLIPDEELAADDEDELPILSLDDDLDAAADSTDSAGTLPDADSVLADLNAPGPDLIARLRPAAPRVDPSPGAPGLRESPEDLLAGARIGFFHINTADGSARFSEAWKSLLGYESDDVADEPDSLAALVHPDDSEACPLTLARTGPFSAEIRLRTKDDTWRWMQLEGVCTKDENGRPSIIDGVMLDIQERREADEETARNEERFLRVSGRGTAGFFELDLAGGQAWYSPEFRRALGRRADELGASPGGFLDVLPPEDAQVGLPAYFQSISMGLPARVTRYQLMHADGRAVEFDAFLTVRRSRRGVIEYVCGLQTAAGDEPRREAAPPPTQTAKTGGLAAAVEQALDAALEPIVLVDPHGLILHVNARAAALAGQTPDRLATRSFHDVFSLVLRETGAPASRLLESALRSGQPLELDQSCQLVGKDGPEDVAISCRPVFDEAHQLTSATVVLRRLAEMPLTQAELVKSNRMEALGRVACGIVHDFNNLLTTVVGGVSLALDKKDLAPLETALKACNNAKTLARQLLTFARGDVTGRRVQSLNDIIRETARMVGAGSKSAVELELSSDLYPVNVVTSQIVQVFTNLILNAMQVMPAGGRIWVRTLNMPLGQVNSVNLPAGDYVRADVQDNGPGIPRENLARIFEPFFTTRAEGTGLGLAMVNSIVAQHEGAIEAASEVGSGTTFTLYFPRAQTEVVQEAPQKISISYGSGRVLIMDDDADLCAIASGMLEMLGYQADTATSAEETLTKFQKAREMGRTYSAVILDLTMAGGPGGEDVVGQLRAIDPTVKAIVSSGYATDEQAEHFRKLGFVAILSKPYRSGDLGRVLKEVLGPPK